VGESPDDGEGDPDAGWPAGLKWAPERLPQREQTRPDGGHGVASPMRARRPEATANKENYGEVGWQKKMGKAQGGEGP